jgi:hypothetical protein
MKYIKILFLLIEFIFDIIDYYRDYIRPRLFLWIIIYLDLFVNVP